MNVDVYCLSNQRHVLQADLTSRNEVVMTIVTPFYSINVQTNTKQRTTSGRELNEIQNKIGPVGRNTNIKNFFLAFTSKAFYESWIPLAIKKTSSQKTLQL